MRAANPLSPTATIWALVLAFTCGGVFLSTQTHHFAERHAARGSGAAPPPAAVAAAAIAEAVLAAPPRRPPYTLTVCAPIRNEAPHLTEWVLYHHLIGVDHLILYDDESSDDTPAVLRPLVNAGLVTYLWWPGRGGTNAAIDAQLRHCFNASNFGHVTRWMAAFDVDEFLALPGLRLSARPFRPGGSFLLHAYLERYTRDGCGGVLLDRMEFSSDGHEAPPEGLVIAEFTERRITTRRPRGAGKTLVRFDGLGANLGAHAFRPAPGWRACFADGSEHVTPEEMWVERHVYEPLRLQHYNSRSYRECVAKVRDLEARQSGDVWRVKVGVAWCDRRMAGRPGYRAEEFTPERLLADSLFPAVIARLAPHFTPRNS